ncbi:hypothetical protein FOG51_01671 [Hanseniaspora uvarum]|jgi:inorganic pyrophosphatase|nr:hypothetical protein FOG48_03766 [Hanseniaspora uvarum]KAF0273425.1 hypothetical protein FOG51_01671 [Hanseniaspora uvarum]KAF0276439.1 hypothetical protein FOG50_02731 [Hanseniaspora uvarum]
MAYTTRQIGSKYTLDYQLFIEDKNTGKVVSPFHDIPLHAEGSTPENPIFNMIVEIPRWSNAKLEIIKEDAFNPIKQDTKKGKLRFVRNCFPHHGYIHNYGAFPQTWEDPNHSHKDTQAVGDNDPLDVLEIGEKIAYTGEVKQVKVLGVMALLDEGETDWKVIVIDINDPLASKLNDIEDVEKHNPGLLRATNEWFRIYKIPDGKPENQFAFNGEAKNREYALNIIAETNESWKQLISGNVDAKDIRLDNSSLGNATTASDAGIPKASALPDSAIDKSIDKWFFISGN